MGYTLTDLGWDEHFETGFAAQRDAGVAAGRVAREDRDHYMVLTHSGEQSARLSGRLRHGATDRSLLPAVGDWVALRSAPDGDCGVIQTVLPRKSWLSRKAVCAGGPAEEQVLAANVDTAFLVSGLNEDFNPRRIERYLATTWDSGSQPVLILNKADLCSDAARCVATIESSACGVAIHVMSAVTGEGCDALTPYLGCGRTVAFLGSSGVGKSTLINLLLGAQRQETRPVREFDGRGRHATSVRELIVLQAGALLIDTPGLRELQLWDDDGGIERVFDDIVELAAGCRFRDCHHRQEPGCAVKAAVAAGQLDAGRLENYLKLQREQNVLAVRRSQRARMIVGPGGKRLR